VSASIAIFLPCRAGSTRVRQKNTRPFAGDPGGLLTIKLRQLSCVRGLDAVVVDSNDAEVLERTQAFRRSWQSRAELRIVQRPDHLGQSDTSTDDLIRYAMEMVREDVLLWTHVTSPLVGPAVYEAALDQYFTRDAQTFDSLMAVTELKTFLWARDGPLNYRRTPIRWPRTQDLPPVYEVNSALFLIDTALGRRLGDRVGQTPLLFPLDRVTALDIDDEEDFRVAEVAMAAVRPAAMVSAAASAIRP
jgi:CMP-N-acetylneuraminic acid synthetase